MLHQVKVHKIFFVQILILLIMLQAATVSAGTDAWTSNGPEGGTICALAVDPETSTTVYAGTHGGGMYKSTDGGENWNKINTGLTASTVFALAIDPITPTTLYAGTWDGGIFKTTNGGDSWTAINSGLYVTIIQALV